MKLINVTKIDEKNVSEYPSIEVEAWKIKAIHPHSHRDKLVVITSGSDYICEAVSRESGGSTDWPLSDE